MMAAARQVSLLVMVCFLLSGCHCQLPTSPDQLNTQVAQFLLSKFSTTLDAITTSVTQLTDEAFQGIITKLENDALVQDAFETLRIKAANAKAPPLAPVTCTGPFSSATRPDDVHKVMIGDIGMIAGIGDSIMAGLGTISNTFLSATTFEGRGYTSKDGGTGSVSNENTTVATIMRDLFQNTKLRGYSVGDGTCSQSNIACAQKNVADKLAFHPSFVLQAIELIRRIIFDPSFDPLEWKIINIFYGPNDLCSLCGDLHYKDLYAMAPLHIRIAVALLNNFLQNTIVYLHIPFDVTPLSDLKDNVACVAIQAALCNCASLTAPLNTLGLGIVSSPAKVNQQYIVKFLMDIANDPTLQRKDFGISVIRHLNNTVPPKVNGVYQKEVLSANCLHPGRAAHYIHARYVFNEMLTPFADRPQSGDYTVNGNTPFTLKCPNGFLQI